MDTLAIILGIISILLIILLLVCYIVFRKTMDMNNAEYRAQLRDNSVVSIKISVFFSAIIIVLGIVLKFTLKVPIYCTYIGLVPLIVLSIICVVRIKRIDNFVQTTTSTSQSTSASQSTSTPPTDELAKNNIEPEIANNVNNPETISNVDNIARNKENSEETVTESIEEPIENKEETEKVVSSEDTTPADKV